MQILSAALAFAITMLILSLVTNVLVETFHRLLRMRSVGLKLMLGHLFDRVIAPLLSEPEGAVLAQRRDEFIDMMTVNRAPTGTAFRGDISRASDGQATGEGDESFFRWPWNGRRLDKLSVEGFMARLGGSTFSDEIRAAGTGSVAGLDLVLADIGQKFADFGNEASLFFQQRARFTAVVISVLVAWFIYVHPFDIFSTFMRDPKVTDAVIALQDATLTEFEAQKADLTASQAALAKAEEAAAMAGGDAAAEEKLVTEAGAEVDVAKAKLEESVASLKNAGVPIGWTDTKMAAVGFCKKSPFELFDLPYPCTGAGFTTAIWLVLGGFLVGLGGPFWYDLVKSLSSIRSLIGAGGVKADDPALPGQADTASSALKPAIDQFKVSAAGRDAVLGGRCFRTGRRAGSRLSDQHGGWTMATVEYVVTAGRLNFRSSADSSGSGNILATLPRGYLLHGESAPVGGEWLKVSAILPSWPEEAEGYVSARYAVETQDATAATVAAVATDAAALAGAGVPALAPQPAGTFRITLAELQELAPNGKAAFMTPLVQNCVAVREHYGLAVTPLHMGHFLAQLAHECAGFRTMREYWGPTNAQKRYEGRADLGNDQPGDGKRFMGRGYIQITGRANYGTYGSKLGLALTASPALAEDPVTALNIACIYWKNRNIDIPAGNNDIGEVTRRINGGTNGLADRTALFRKARKLWP